MVDKITSWKFVEEFIEEPVSTLKARARADEFGIECVTPATGAQLAFIASSLGAKSIVEAGTGAGVSGLWLLSASTNSILATIDDEPDYQAAAKLAFQDANIADNRTRVISGKVTEVMSNMADAAYDLVFLDADKETLEEQLHESVRLLRPGGAVVIAHALWRDRVPDPAMRDEATVAYRDAMRFLAQNENFVTAVSTVGDGLVMASKRS
ncbi:MAG: O-methyltransferase [Rhodoluna sp.]|jgi:predicted O-methyltransferase YrrM|nr:O-methyltransferase [Rhodoluna sp.]